MPAFSRLKANIAHAVSSSDKPSSAKSLRPDSISGIVSISKTSIVIICWPSSVLILIFANFLETIDKSQICQNHNWGIRLILSCEGIEVTSNGIDCMQYI
ncbi:Uncharacterised protein [Legionella pneumophila]|nr:Uncharacterised protein [Legionella pneumophila]